MDDILATDPFDDIILPTPATTAKPVKKFQPKPRAKQPIKPVSKALNPSNYQGEKLVNNDTLGSNATWVAQASTEMGLEDDPLFHSIGGAPEATDASCISSSSLPMDLSSLASETLEPSNATRVLSGMESHEKLFVEPCDAVGKEIGKFQPKSTLLLQKPEAKSVSFILPDAAKIAPPPVEPDSFSQPEEENGLSKSFSLSDAVADVLYPVGAHPDVLTCDWTEVEPSLPQMKDDESVEKIPRTSVFSDDMDIQLDHRSARNEDLADFSPLEPFSSVLSEPTNVAGRNVAKFQPKRGTDRKTIKSVSVGDANDMESISSQLASSATDSEPWEDCHLGIPAEPLTDFVDEQANLVDAISLEAEVEEQTEPIFKSQPTSKAFEEPGAGKSRRKLSKRTAVDSSSGKHDWETDENDDAENLNNSQVNENINDDEYKGEDFPNKRKQPKGLKRQMTDTQKPARKSKKTSNELHSTKPEPSKKKFPHGTRKKKKGEDQVVMDKEYLDTYDNEAGRRKLVLSELIKLQKLRMQAVSDESSENNKRYNLTPQQKERRENIRNSEKLNYHTYMPNKPQRGKWSKNETELFYEGIRQFGTDFSMIEKLFPNRTRHQVKLKFKMEERRHPTELHDAMIHRSKDLSHFESVLQKLQAEADAEAAEESRLYDTNEDPAIVFQDAVNGNEEDRYQPETEQQKVEGFDDEATNPEVHDEWDVDDTLENNEFEDIQWDAEDSLQDEEKYREYDDL